MPEAHSRLGSYRRPSEDMLDALTETRRDALDTAGNSENRGNSDTAGVSDTAEILVTSVTPGTSGPARSPVRKPARPRDHIKLDQELAQRMRNAVWFLAEHGRPRVQLGELIDEAVSQWLAKAEASYNGGESFPDRGRLR